MLKSRQTHFCGVLGWPLEHTLSPVIHNVAFRRLGLDWIYLSFPVAPESLGDAVAGLRALGARGANVTMPHKESVIGFLDRVTPEAEAVGAVNTIENAAGELIGHNTDVAGFREFLVGDAGVEVAGRRVLVLGAGGAARAVVKALGEMNAGPISVAARTAARAETLEELAVEVGVVDWDAAPAAGEAADLIVNCTPLGMQGELSLEGPFRSGQTVVDLIYAPPRTPLLIKATDAGADTWGGLGMLVHQAAEAFTILTGLQPPIEAMSAAAVHVLGGGGSGQEQ